MMKTDKQCPDGKIYNPVSKRYVLKTGAIGKAILKNASKQTSKKTIEMSKASLSKITIDKKNISVALQKKNTVSLKKGTIDKKNNSVSLKKGTIDKNNNNISLKKGTIDKKNNSVSLQKGNGPNNDNGLNNDNAQIPNCPITYQNNKTIFRKCKENPRCKKNTENVRREWEIAEQIKNKTDNIMIRVLDVTETHYDMERILDYRTVWKKSEYKKNMFSDLLTCLQTMHKHGIIYVDMHAGNIGFSELDKKWKFFDFDVSGIIHTDAKSDDGNMKYRNYTKSDAKSDGPFDGGIWEESLIIKHGLDDKICHVCENYRFDHPFEVDIIAFKTLIDYETEGMKICIDDVNNEREWLEIEKEKIYTKLIEYEKNLTLNFQHLK